ncbi:MAG: cell envelope integrity protein CreD [Proteobacteria bacterium]|nr:cell envelope integrity protein CreD [Pseudomonadota bacterium]
MELDNHTGRTVSVKAGILTALSLLLLIPLAMLASLVADRVNERNAAIESVARGWGQRQWLAGPVIAVPVTDDDDPKYACDWYVLPDRLDLSVDLGVQPEQRRLGLYQVPVYVARVRARGQFDLPRELGRFARGNERRHAHPERARLLLPVQDPRGLRSLSLNMTGFDEPGPTGTFPIAALAAPLVKGADLTRNPVPFEINYNLAGTQSLGFLPLARAMQVEVRGNWPDPGFSDGLLPVERHVTANGFTALWQVLELNRPYGDRWLEGTVGAQALLASGFSVELVQPVDIYQRCLRAVKYGGLFIALSFLTLFLLETLLHTRLHPVQYGLMGLALSVFYLLLLALAEHLGFVASYLLAALALCSLMGVYLGGALHSRRAGFITAGVLGITYALLYLLVTSENYALLAGAITLFALLATVMVLTRRLDWYSGEEA